MRNRAKATAWMVVWVLGLASFFPADIRRAAAQEGSKGIQPEAAGVGNRRKPRTGKPKKQQGKYRTSRPFTPTPAPAGRELAQLGVTIWRLRPSAGSGQAKDLTDEGEANEKKAGTLERIEGDTPLAVGEKVRISIESLSHRGHLYIIDREQYADGSQGKARLIFPTMRTRRGNNYVEPGQLIDIPTATRSFTIEQKTPGKVLVAEALTLVLSPKPLDLPSELTEKAMLIPDDWLLDWERRWKSEAVQLELEGGAGQTLTAREQSVIEGNAKDLVDDDRDALSQDDPLPQTVYRAIIKKGDAIFVTVRLRIK